MPGKPSLTLDPVLLHRPVTAMRSCQRPRNVHILHNQQHTTPDTVFPKIQLCNLSRLSHLRSVLTNRRQYELPEVVYIVFLIPTFAIGRTFYVDMDDDYDMAMLFCFSAFVFLLFRRAIRREGILLAVDFLQVSKSSGGGFDLDGTWTWTEPSFLDDEQRHQQISWEACDFLIYYALIQPLGNSKSMATERTWTIGSTGSLNPESGIPDSIRWSFQGWALTIDSRIMDPGLQGFRFYSRTTYPYIFILRDVHRCTRLRSTQRSWAKYSARLATGSVNPTRLLFQRLAVFTITVTRDLLMPVCGVSNALCITYAKVTEICPGLTPHRV